MNLAVYSASASAWLELVDPDPAWLMSSGAGASAPYDLVVIPGELETDYERGNRESEDAQILTWNPETLKQVFDHALRLSRSTGRFHQMMKNLSEKETALRRLHAWIGVTSKGSPERRPSAVCLHFDQHRMRKGNWTVMGHWVPDLIDRAGGRPLLTEPGDPSIRALPRDLETAQPNVLFFAMDDIAETSSDSMAAACMFLDDHSLSGTAYLMDADSILSTGPVLHDIVFHMASGLHPETTELSAVREKLIKIK